MDVQTVPPKDLYTLISGGQTVDLIDVRTPAEYAEVHATPARNIPLDRLEPKQLRPARGERLYVICKSGMRGSQACQKLLAANVAAVVNVQGGTDAWVAAGLPVVRGRKTISLERQVRIAAGLLACTGAVLALAAHPYFALLPAFVGAGLVFAGVTDTCGMALLLARMPWNRRGVSCGR